MQQINFVNIDANGDDIKHVEPLAADHPASAGHRRLMINANRARAAELRARQWSDKALDALASHAFASHAFALAMDRDGDSIVRDAIKRYADFSRTYWGAPVEPAFAWRNAYGIARCLVRSHRGQ